MRITLSAVQKQIEALVNAQEAIQAARKKSTASLSKNEYTAALQRAVQEKERLKKARFQLYDNLQKGIIDQEEYDHFREQYKAELLAQEENITRLQSGIAKAAEARKSDDEFVAFFEKFGNIQTLDRSVVTTLIDRIVVEDAKNIGVYFKFSAECERIFDLAHSVQESA